VKEKNKNKKKVEQSKRKATLTPQQQSQQKPKKAKTTNDLITQSAKKFNDIFSTDSASSSNSPIVVFNVTGVDASLLELREVLKRFRDTAVGTSFSPGKFPSALRSRLNETICTCLRAARPTISNPLPTKLFPALAAFLPFSPSALTKLLTKKILNPLIDSLDTSEIPKLYSQWSAIVTARIKEDGGVVLQQATTAASTTSSLSKISTTTNDEPSVEPVQPPPTVQPASPMKRRLKFNDEMRVQVFEIIRAETDLNNLICLRNLLSASANEPVIDTSISPRTVQSELNLRKIVYQKLVNLTSDSDNFNNAIDDTSTIDNNVNNANNNNNDNNDNNANNNNNEQAITTTTTTTTSNLLLSTTEISKEFASQRRKHEKRISKLASEILFGEAEVEEFLKDLFDSSVKSTATTNVNNNATTIPNSDPLNLFKEESAANESAANTSLLMDSNEAI
jgi:hypothetical protein